MIKSRIQIVLNVVVFAWSSLSAQQNLIFNGSFEQYDSCDGYIGNVSVATNWVNSNGGTSDWFHSCIVDTFGMPSNFAGFQIANEGSAYAGVVIAEAINAREGIEGVLSIPLLPNKYYCVEMAVSLADSFYYAIDEIGVYFDTDSVEASDFTYNNNSLPYQVKMDVSGILDSSSWHVISGGYLASGNEKYMVISVFLPNLTWTKYRFNSLDDKIAYYYIDNIKVYDCTIPDITIPGGFSPNGDGINDVFEIVNLVNYPENSLYVINRWGDMVYKAEPYLNDWDGKSNTGMNLWGDRVTDGTYFYVFTPYPGANPMKGSLEIRSNK